MLLLVVLVALGVLLAAWAGAGRATTSGAPASLVAWGKKASDYLNGDIHAAARSRSRSTNTTRLSRR
ncbi:MAG: hypothetical protein FWD75_02865 [Propionibacteriaceae bacterium]|nr:hypothetical protein [Propionibacteriaceae bacterium]